MAAFSVIGFVDAVKVQQDFVLLFVSEYKKGYKKKTGEVVDDKYISWKVIFKSSFRKYIIDHFAKGMLVEVKGEVFPYAIEHGEFKDGISVVGQCVNMFSYPRSSVKQELRMIKESQDTSTEQPNLDEFNREDF